MKKRFFILAVIALVGFIAFDAASAQGPNTSKDAQRFSDIALLEYCVNCVLGMSMGKVQRATISNDIQSIRTSVREFHEEMFVLWFGVRNDAELWKNIDFDNHLKFFARHYVKHDFGKWILVNDPLNWESLKAPGLEFQVDDIFNPYRRWVMQQSKDEAVYRKAVEDFNAAVQTAIKNETP